MSNQPVSIEIEIPSKITDSSRYQYKNDKYAVFNLTNNDKYCDTKFILTNDVFIEQEEELEELLIPCFKEPIVDNFKYLEKFLMYDENSVLGRGNIKREVDNQRIPVISIEHPIILAEILKSAFTGHYKVNVKNCIKSYKIYDFINMEDQANCKPVYYCGSKMNLAFYTTELGIILAVYSCIVK